MSNSCPDCIDPLQTGTWQNTQLNPKAMSSNVQLNIIYWQDPTRRTQPPISPADAVCRVIFHGSVPDWRKARVPTIILTIRAEQILHFSKISFHLHDKGKNKQTTKNPPNSGQNLFKWIWQKATYSSAAKDNHPLCLALSVVLCLAEHQLQHHRAWGCREGENRFKQVPSILS